MPCSAGQIARRALVRVLLSLAAAYGVPLGLERDASDTQVAAAYRRVVKAVHPDKGGNVSDAQRLQAAKEQWDKTRRQNTRAGRPATGQARPKGSGSRSGGGVGPSSLGNGSVEAPRQYRINACATMLTYNGFVDKSQWHRFLAFVRAGVTAWQVKHWCATLEASTSESLHVHLMLQFTKQVDRTSRSFVFEGCAPRADPNDILGEGWCRKRLQQSINRAMFYCWAEKIGTQRNEDGTPCVAGNYFPCWAEGRFKYPVLGRWPENLWKARKLTHDKYEEYLFACRDGVQPRKRNLDACRDKEEQVAERKEMCVVVDRIRQNPAIFKPFPPVPVAQSWLQNFTKDALRYPIMIVLGPSSSGKTEWAKSLFRNSLELKIGTLEHFPDEMRRFSRQQHDALILDDVRDLNFLVSHQEKLQGKYDAQLEFAATPGGTCSFRKWLFQVPTVVTINYTTKNLHYLEQNDWLGKEANRVLIQWPLPA